MKKLKKDFRDITFVGAGLGVGLSVEGKLKPSIPVFTKAGPIIAHVATVKGASMVIGSLDKLSKVGKSRRKK